MKKSELQQIIKEEIKNTLKAYGPDIKNLTPKDNEVVWLDDTTGELSGEVVTKKEYLSRMLQKALNKKDWSIISAAKLYLQTQL
jgi:hypothetical protein